MEALDDGGDLDLDADGEGVGEDFLLRDDGGDLDLRWAVGG
jgi:hypothetical protein